MFVFSVARPFVCGCHIISTLPSARTIPGLPGSLASLLHRVARTHLGAMGWNQCAFAPIVRARPFPIFGRPVHPRDRSRRLRPGGSPHALQTPPRGGRPALQSFRSWLQLCLGRIRLSPSCPFRHLPYLPTLRPVRHYPHLLDIDPWPRAERDFNPPETRAARHALPMDLPPSASSPLRGRRSRFGFQYRVSADWITQCPLSVWVDAPTVGPDIEAIGLPGVRHATSSYTVRLQLPSVTTVGYRDSLSYACSSPSGHPSSRFAVRYVHEFCLMLLPDAPSLRLPVPCWCSPSVRSRWLSFLQLACHARHTSATARRAGGMMKAPRGGLERMKRAKALPE